MDMDYLNNNNDSQEQPEEASKLGVSGEKAESVTSETSKMKIEELTGEDAMDVDSSVITSSNVKSSASSKTFKLQNFLFIYSLCCRHESF